MKYLNKMNQFILVILSLIQIFKFVGILERVVGQFKLYHGVQFVMQSN